MQTSDSFFERSLGGQGGAAQELRCYQEAKSLLGNERFGRLEPLQCQFWLAAIEVKHRMPMQRYRQTERVGNPLSQCQCVIAKRYTLLGVPEQPLGLRTCRAGADAGIVPAIELTVEDALGYGMNISKVMLMSLPKRLGICRRNLLRVVAKRRKLTCNVVRCHSRFDANKAGWEVRKP